MLRRPPGFVLASPFRLKDDCWQNGTLIMISLKTRPELAAIPVLFSLVLCFDVFASVRDFFRPVQKTDFTFVLLLTALFRQLVFNRGDDCRELSQNNS